jgi:hypothetical protein
MKKERKGTTAASHRVAPKSSACSLLISRVITPLATSRTQTQQMQCNKENEWTKFAYLIDK